MAPVANPDPASPLKTTPARYASGAVPPNDPRNRLQSPCASPGGTTRAATTSPDRIAYFSALRDSLAPGARLPIVDPRRGAPCAGPPDEFRVTREEIDEELSRAGYEWLSQHDFLPRQTFQIYGAGRSKRDPGPVAVAGQPLHDTRRIAEALVPGVDLGGARGAELVPLARR